MIGKIEVKLLEEFQGKGYGYETLILLTKYIFEELNMNRIFVNILEYNECSMSLFEKIGFVREGIQRKAIYKNGIDEAKPVKIHPPANKTKPI